jgi:hypothetical protein
VLFFAFAASASAGRVIAPFATATAFAVTTQSLRSVAFFAMASFAIAGGTKSSCHCCLLDYTLN